MYPDVRYYRFVDADFIGSCRDTDIERIKTLALTLTKAGFRREEGFHFWIESQSRNIVCLPVKVWKTLQQAGTFHVFIGVETGSQRMKKLFRKASSPEIDIEAISRIFHKVMIQSLDELSQKCEVDNKAEGVYKGEQREHKEIS